MTADPSERGFRQRLLDVAKLATPAFFTPLITSANHYGYLTRDYRLYVLSLGLLLILYILAKMLGKLFSDIAAGVSVSVLVGAVVIQGDRLATIVPGAALGVAALIAAFVGAVFLLERPSVVVALVGWLVLAMWLWIGAEWAQTLIGREPSQFATWQAESLKVVGTIEDVVILIVDEYPNSEFLSTIQGGQGASAETWLVNEGFEVDGSIRTPYALTEYALPSFLMLELPLEAGASLSEPTRSDLLRILGGDNPVVESFRDAGYRSWMVESGWSGLRCSSVIDECIERSWYDEGTASILRRSLLAKAIYGELGSAFSHGVERTIDWIRLHLPSLLNNDSRDLVIIHLMLPHAPLAFDERCLRREADAQVNEAAFLDQLACANMVIQDVAKAGGKEPITVIVGDHGSQLSGQTGISPQQWSREMALERMRTIGAVRGLEGCSEPPPSSTLNLLVRLMRCLGAEVEYSPDVALATSVDGEPLVDVFWQR